VTGASISIEAVRAGREMYQRTGNLDAIKESVRIGRLLVDQLTGCGTLEGPAALELSAALAALYEKDGQLQQLEEALDLLERAIAVLPPRHADLATVHANKAGLRLHRFLKLRDRRDLESAVTAGRLAIEVSEPDDPRQAARYANLTGVLRTLYDVIGDSAILDESITVGRAASAALQPSTQARCMVLATLAGSLVTRALRTISTSDLTEGLTTAREAVASSPPGSPWRPAAVNILATCLRVHFNMAGNISSLGEAIGLHREMADLVPRQHPEYATHLLAIASTLMTRFELLRVQNDLDAAEEAADRALGAGNALSEAEALRVRAVCLQERAKLAADRDRTSANELAQKAVEAAKQALALTDATDDSHQNRWIQLCNAMAVRFEVTQAAAHRDDAIAAYKEAIERAGSDPSIQYFRLNLGRVYQLATDSGPASRADIDSSISLYRLVLASAEPGERVWAPAIVGLLRAYSQLFQIDQKVIDTNELVQLHQSLTDAPAVAPISRVYAGLLTGTLLLAISSREAARILTGAVHLLPAVAWRGIDRESREGRLADLSGLAADAAASQLLTGDVDAALEVIEQGRSVLWADLLQLRRGDAELWRDQPDEAIRLRDLAAALETQEMISSEDHHISRTVDRRMALAAEWDEIVERVREQGRDDFLRPTRVPDLLAAAAHGPVVIVNVSQYRCDALLVNSDGVRSVALPALSAQDVESNTKRYLAAHARVDRAVARKAGVEDARLAREETLVEVLGWLWDTVAEPVLAALGLDDSPAKGQLWSRMWWCPTGLLTLLPLHAAGHYTCERDSSPRTVPDRVVSSYTPTLSALADAKRTAAPDEASGTLLFVGLPETPGAKPLPGASKERDLLAQMLGGSCTILYGQAATKAATRTELPRHLWAHFSCHGRQNLAAPSKGGLRLYDGALTVADMSTVHYRREFAFLSACQTATGGTALPDEVISLAAAMHYTGYRHVVATLWSVYDRAGLEIAERLYADLIVCSQLDPTRSAHALHSAIQELRNKHPLSPSWWIPFIHIGP
jgi:tetratricopeptide (TPR) repeat protein